MRIKERFYYFLSSEKKSGHRRSFSSWLILALAVVCMVGGVYLLWILFATPLYMPVQPKEWNHPVAKKPQELTEDRLYIPKLKLNLTFISGNASVLDFNVWHRFPERGDPEIGGNFILAGHRFEMGTTPGETARKSPFYHVDKIATGDIIYVDFKGLRYKYVIAEKLTVKPTQVEIEASSEESKLTLYTCTLRGDADGREVLIAHMIAKNVDPTKSF